jgi:hypothetical protein
MSATSELDLIGRFKLLYGLASATAAKPEPLSQDSERARTPCRGAERHERNLSRARGDDLGSIPDIDDVCTSLDLTTRPSIDPAVEAEIARIWPEAQRLGWPRERIWNPDYWPHTVERPRGLASVLEPGNTIIEVGDCHITILSQRRYLQPFPKADRRRPT